MAGSAVLRPHSAQPRRHAAAAASDVLQHRALVRPDSAPPGAGRRVSRRADKVAPAGWAAAMQTFAPGSVEAEAARKAIQERTPQKPGPEGATASAEQRSSSPVFSPAEDKPAAEPAKGVRNSLVEVEALVGQELDGLFTAAAADDSFDVQAALCQARRDAATRAAAERGCREAQQEARAATQQSEELRSELDALRSQHQTLQRELAEHCSAAVEVAALQTELRDTKEHLARAELVKHSAQQADQATQADAQQADQATQASAQQADQATQASAQQVDQATQADSHRGDGAEPEAARESTTRQAEVELAKVTGELSEMRAVAHSACEERASLQQQLEAAEQARSREVARRAAAEGALSDAEETINDLETAAAAAAASAISKIMQAKADAAETVAVAEARATEAESRLDQFSTELSAKERRFASTDGDGTADEIARLQRQLADLNGAFATERAALESKVRSERALAKELEAEAQDAVGERDAVRGQLQAMAAQLESQRAASVAGSDELRQTALREVDALKALHVDSIAALELKLTDARRARDAAIEATTSLRQELDNAEVKAATVGATAARAEVVAAETMDGLRAELAAAHESLAMESERCEMLAASADEARSTHAEQVARMQEEIAAALRAADEAERQRERGVAAAAAAAADIVRTRTNRRGSAGKGDEAARRRAERAAAPPADRWPDM
jgi:chromosome segregation ATPase